MDEVAGQNSGKICNPCHEENISTSSDGFCRECKELMCQTCFHHHLRAKYCRKHVLLEVTYEKSAFLLDNEVDIYKCMKHGNESLRFYCRKHDVIGCGDCMLFDGHNECNPEYINDEAVNFSKTEDFQNLIARHDTIKSSMAKQLRKSTIYKNEVKDKLINDVKKFRKRVDSYLDKAEDDSLSFVNKMQTENNISVGNLKETFKKLETQIEEYKHELDTLKDADLILFMVLHLVKNKLKQIEDNFNDAKISNKIIFFEFIPDQDLSELIFAPRAFGRSHKISRKCMMISTSRPVGVGDLRATERGGMDEDNNKDEAEGGETESGLAIIQEDAKDV